jgi:hypothetical protein
MKHLRVAILIAAVCTPASALAGELVLTFKDGRVTLKATDASLRQILNEWARLGQTRMTGLEKLTGSPLTLELVDVPEKQALEILLRSVAGYIAAPRAVMASASVSRFDRLALLPTSIASAAPVAAARPAAFVPPPPTPFPDPTQLANEEPDQNDAPTPPGIPVFSPNGEPVNTLGPGGPGTQPISLGPNPIRPYQSPNDPNTPPPAPVNGPEVQAPAPLVTARPGVIPLPQPQPRP